MEEKVEKEEVKDLNDMDNQLEEQKINENKEKDNTKMEEEKEKKINEIKNENEKEKEDKVSKTENINNNIFGNMNNNFFLDYIAIIKQQIKNELCQEMLKKGTDNSPEPFNPKENKNQSNAPNDNNTNNFLGKKRLKSPPEDLINNKNSKEI